MRYRVKNITDEKDILKYAEAFNKSSGCNIPPSYFANENILALFDDAGNIVGGFAIIFGPAQRVVYQIPDKKIRANLYLTTSELTGYFINNKKGSFLLTVRLVWEVLKNRRNNFIFSFPTNNLKLKNYYLKGKPKIIYIGKLRNMDGVPPHINYSETVGILTKYGVLRIFIYRTINILIKKFKGLL